MDDQGIVDLYWARNEQAIAETEKKYGSYCRSIAQNILRNRSDTEECVNDTWLQTWNSLPPHRPAVLSTYLAKITRRLSIDIFRGKTRQKRQGSEYALSLSELGECVSGGNTTEEIVNVKLLADAIGIYLRTLPADSRNLFLCRYYFLDSLKEAARECGMTESKAKSLLHRTRLGLKDYLRKEGFDL